MGNANSGRRPQPTALKSLRGNPSRRRLAPDLAPPAGPVVKPVLSADADRVWEGLAPLCLRMGTLSPADASAFATLCELQASFTANAQTRGRKAFDAGLERSLAAALRPYYALFGLEPVSRARLAPPAAPVSKWAALA